MKVLFVCPNPELSTRSIFVPLGILSVATYLNKKGHTVKFIDRSVHNYNIKKIIEDFNPGIVGISIMSTKAIRDAKRISETVKSCHIPVVWGGTLVSASPTFMLSSGCMDYVVVGEGELTMLALIDTLNEGTPLREVKGLAFIENGKAVVNDYREFAHPAELPIIDWSLTNPAKYFRSFFACNKMMYLYGSKGCPGQCTFCTNEEYNRSTCRTRPIENLLTEIEHLVTKHGMDGVYFTDEYVCKTKPEMHVFCDHLRNTGLKFVWGATTKINDFSEEDFKYMYDSGCRWLFFGIESGSKERLKLIKKGIAYDKIVKTVANCHLSGIVPITGYMIGFPDETEDELQQTINLALQLPFAMQVINIFIPLPGSELYKTLKAEGRLTLPKSLDEIAAFTPFEEVVQNLSNVSTRDLKIIRAFFMLSVFSRKKPSGQTTSFVLASKVLKEQFRDMTRDGILMFFVNFSKSVGTFLSLLSYVTFYPRARKKYSLYSRVAKRITDKF